MLALLEIKNVALIDHAVINFDQGLNVLSGETGSGKSVIIESLNFVLGAKADKTLIKNGQNECFVRAEFTNLNNVDIEKTLNEFEIESEEVLIITRKLNVDGKGTVKINGQTVTVSMLKKITSLLVDVHGQSEHFYLLKESNQLEMLDRLGKDEITSKKNIVCNLYNEYKKIIDSISELGGSEKDREIRLDVINYQINEIESADLKEGEEEELKILKDKINNLEKIQLALSNTKCALSDEGGASDILYNATKSISSVTALDPKFNDLYNRLYSVMSEIDDISNTTSNILDDFSNEDVDINYIEDRLDKIKVLKRKYGDNYDDITNFLASIIEEKNKLINFNDIYKNLLDEKTLIEDKLYVEYKKLSDIRRLVANKLSKNVVSELIELGITKGQFYVVFNDFASKDECEFNSPNGIDRVCFMFSANQGQPAKPLSDVISGGEMSRFMLAIKSQTAKENYLSTFIFDEIDAGISGNVAKVVAKKFAKISTDVQVIAITHLPQISVMADNNILITKTENDNSTLTNVKILDDNDKVNEIIRLIGGDSSSLSAKDLANQLISEANEYKKTLKIG